MRLKEITKDKILHPPSISVGDEVKVGKFKNRKAEVKGFTKDEHGQPVLKTTKGDQKLYKPRVTKLEPKEKSMKLDEITKDQFVRRLKDPVAEKIFNKFYKMKGSLKDKGWNAELYNNEDGTMRLRVYRFEQKAHEVVKIRRTVSLYFTFSDFALLHNIELTKEVDKKDEVEWNLIYETRLNEIRDLDRWKRYKVYTDDKAFAENPLTRKIVQVKITGGPFMGKMYRVEFDDEPSEGYGIWSADDTDLWDTKEEGEMAQFNKKLGNKQRRAEDT